MRNTLVVAELALSLVLLIGAGLFVRSFVELLRADLGVKPDHVVTMNLRLPREKYTEDEQRRNFFQQLLQRVASLPSVSSAGGVDVLPLSGGSNRNKFQIVGQPAFEKDKEPYLDFRIATPDYFAAIGTDLRRGRLFNAQDDEKAPRVILVNEAFAARYLKGMDAVGQRVTFGTEKKGVKPTPPSEIIGVVANVINDNLDDISEPSVYMSFAQVPTSQMNLVIRAQGTVTQLVPAIRQELIALDPRLPLTEAKTMEEVVYERRSPKEMMMWTLVIFGAMALLMAAVGTYAVMAYAVAQRTHEIGVRMALGALPSDILKMVLRRGLSLALIGIGLGLAGAFALTRALGQLLYGVTATDPLTFIGISLLLGLVALVACLVPARRATKVDPLVALRCD